MHLVWLTQAIQESCIYANCFSARRVFEMDRPNIYLPWQRYSIYSWKSSFLCLIVFSPAKNNQKKSTQINYWHVNWKEYVTTNILFLRFMTLVFKPSIGNWKEHHFFVTLSFVGCLKLINPFPFRDMINVSNFTIENKLYPWPPLIRLKLEVPKTK